MKKQLILKSDLEAFELALSKLDDLEIRIMNRIKKARGLAKRPDLYDLMIEEVEPDGTFDTLFTAFGNPRITGHDGLRELEALHSVRVKIGQEVMEETGTEVAEAREGKTHDETDNNCGGDDTDGYSLGKI